MSRTISHRMLAITLLAALVGCNEKPAAPALRPAAIAPSVTPVAPAPASGSGVSDYVPAENKQGAGRWKDTGVYVDGKPTAFLNFGELPIHLKPVWVHDRISENKRPGSDDPGWRWAQQRYYRFDEYLTALGIDLHRVKEIHVYGPKLSQTIIATGKDLLSPAAKGFMFRFGGSVFGKAIPQVPYEFGNGKSPDKISGVMVYLDKKPPTLTRTGLELDGVPQLGVPYFGDPIRGGVRVYLDDKLTTVLKRQDLKADMATTASDGELQWKLADVLKSQGVDLSKAVEMWVVRGEVRHERYAATDFGSLTFEAGAQAKGGVLIGGGSPVEVAIPGMPVVAPPAAGSALGDSLVKANVLAFHTTAVRPDQIPVPIQDDF